MFVFWKYNLVYVDIVIWYRFRWKRMVWYGELLVNYDESMVFMDWCWIFIYMYSSFFYMVELVVNVIECIDMMMSFYFYLLLLFIYMYWYLKRNLKRDVNINEIVIIIR